MAGLFWGLPYFFIALALESFSTPTIVFARTFLGALVLIPYAALTGGLRPALRAWPYVVMFGLIEMVGPWFLITEAEKNISSGLAGLLIATVPFFAVAVLAIFLKDRKALRPRSLAGMLIGFFGVVVLVGIDSFLGAVNPLFVMMVILAAVGYSIAPIIASRKLNHVPSAGVIGVSMAMVSIVYAPFSLPGLGDELGCGYHLEYLGDHSFRPGLFGVGVCGVLHVDSRGWASQSHSDYLRQHCRSSLIGHCVFERANHYRSSRWIATIAIGLYLAGGTEKKREIPETPA